MAATDKGVWDVQEVRDKALQNQWGYTGALNMYMTGVGNYGSMGLNQGPGQYRSSPTQLPGSWAGFSASYNDAVGLKDDGTLWAWGRNDDGALGQNNKTRRSSPTQIGTETTWASCLMQEGAAFATKTDGSLWSWGKNHVGQLGHNNKTEYESPKQVGTDTTWTGSHGQLDGGEFSVGAIKTDGTLWRWGSNDEGQLGQNNKTEYSSPRQVPGTWTYFAGGAQSSLQIKSGGTVWFTGSGTRYANGIGSQTGYSSPRQVPGLDEGGQGAGPFGTATVVASMEKGTGFVINTDGELYSWGYNSAGQVGKNKGAAVAQFYSPQQIPGTTWSHIDTARTAAFATKTDGTLWGWGQNFQGYLGQNDQNSRSSPIQIGTGESWELTRTKSYFAGAMGLIEQA